MLVVLCRGLCCVAAVQLRATERLVVVVAHSGEEDSEVDGVAPDT
jgi:hypothetical protein